MAAILAYLAWSWRPLRFELNREGRKASAKAAMKVVMAAILAWSWHPLRFELNREGRKASAKVAMKFVMAAILARVAV